MKIDALEAWHVRLPLLYPWRTAYGEDWSIDSVIVRLQSDEHEGWGETTPFGLPTYSPETASTVLCLIDEAFAPAIVGGEFETAEEMLGRLAHFKGNPFAKAGIETAWWDLRARINGRPLGALIGARRERVDAGADFGVQDNFDMLLEKIQGAVYRGHRRTKLKVRPGWDLEMLRVVRSAFPDHTFHVDCNSGYSLSDLPLFRQIDRLGLAMIEQPLHHRDLLDHAELQRHLETPVCLDESITSERDLEQALRIGACRVVNVKIGRVGGLSVARAIHDRARDAGVPCWVGGMLESGIGAGLNIELAGLENFTYPGDLFPTSAFYAEDLTEPRLTMNPDCTFSLSRMPGTPYRPVRDRVEARAVRSVRRAAE